MRELKFRAWDSRNHEMVYSSNTDCFYVNTKGVLFMYAIPKSESGLETIYHKGYDVDQFAGLQDINGKDIYEGDIVKTHELLSASIVEFSSGKDSRVSGHGSSAESMNSGFCISCYGGEPEVIGNIHENPELIP